MAPSDPPVSSLLVEYVPGDDGELYDDLHLTVIYLETESPERMYTETAENAAELVDNKRTNLSALIDVIHKAIVSKRTWASRIAVELYRTMFATLDLDFAIDDGQPSRTTTGKDVIMCAIIEKCIRQIESDFEWTSEPVSNVLEFIDVFFAMTRDSTSATAIGNVIVRMFTSSYLLFEKNLSIFQDFALRLEPHINDLILPHLATSLHIALQRVRDWEEHKTPIEVRATEQSLGHLGPPQGIRSTNLTENRGVPGPHVGTDDNAGFADPTSESSNRTFTTWREPYRAVQTEEEASIVASNELDDIEDGHSEDEGSIASLKELDENPDRAHPFAKCTIDRMQMCVKIGAPPDKLEVAYAVISSMVKSHVVFCEPNLDTLLFFLLRVGPVLDAMATSRRSMRLTALMKALKHNPSERTLEQERVISTVCQHLGRKYTPGSVRRKVREEEAEGGVSLLV